MVLMESTLHMHTSAPELSARGPGHKEACGPDLSMYSHADQYVPSAWAHVGQLLRANASSQAVRLLKWSTTCWVPI